MIRANVSKFLRSSRRGQAALAKSATINSPHQQLTKVTTLESGLRVASVDMHCPTMTVGLWCDCGSRYENDDNNGVAHYFEHLVFKGSTVGGKDGGRMTQDELELTVENKGCMLNAYDKVENTFYFEFLSHMPLILKIVINFESDLDLTRTDGLFFQRIRRRSKLYGSAFGKYSSKTSFRSRCY